MITLSWPYLRGWGYTITGFWLDSSGWNQVAASVQLLDATSEPLWVINSLICCIFISERWIIFSQGITAALWHAPAKFPSVGLRRCDGEKRFDPYRLKPLDPQKHRGEVMIGALIEASHWGLKAQRGHVSFGSKALPTLPQIHLPPTPPTYTKASQSGGGRGRGPHFRFKSRRLKILRLPRQLRRRCQNDEEKEALSPIKKWLICKDLCVCVHL